MAFVVLKHHVRLAIVLSTAVHYDYSLMGVRRSSTVQEITDDIAKWLQGSSAAIAAAVQTSSVELVYMPSGDAQSAVIFPKTDTVESVDLFNRMPDTYIVTIDGNDGNGTADHWGTR